MSDSLIIRAFQIRILFYRKTKNLTQSEIAEKAKISLRHYQRIEACQLIPKLDTAYKISKALDLNLKSLIGEDHQFSKECVIRDHINSNSLTKNWEEELENLAHELKEERTNLLKNIKAINNAFKAEELISSYPLSFKNSFLASIDGIKFSEKFKTENAISKKLVPYSEIMSEEKASNMIVSQLYEDANIYNIFMNLDFNGKESLFVGIYSFVKKCNRSPIIYGHMINIDNYSKYLS